MSSDLGQTLRDLARNFTPEEGLKVATAESMKLMHRVEQWAQMKEWEPVSERVLAQQPSLVVAEGIFALLFFICLIHALRRGRVHFLVFWSSVVVGLLHEVVALVLLPEVATFYRSHAVIMVGPTTPLYTFFVYTSLLYCTVVSGFSLQLGLFGNSAFVGLLGGLFYSVYDMVGTKMLWWTWHGDDRMLTERVLDVPVLSTMWAMILPATFSFLLYLFISRSRNVSIILFIITSFVLMVFTLPLVLASTLLVPYISEQVDRPDLSCLLVLVSFLVFVASFRMNSTSKWMTKRSRPTLMDGFLSTAINVYLAGMTFVAFFFEPSSQLSYGLRQPIGDCHETESDLLGLTRSKYLCSESFSSPFVQEDSAQAGEWYSVRGIPIPGRQVWILLVVLLSLITMMLFTYLLTAPPAVAVVPTPLPTDSAKKPEAKQSKGKNQSTKKNKK